jgi:hypothetical protein
MRAKKRGIKQQEIWHFIYIPDSRYDPRVVLLITVTNIHSGIWTSLRSAKSIHSLRSAKLIILAQCKVDPSTELHPINTKFSLNFTCTR